MCVMTAAIDIVAVASKLLLLLHLSHHHLEGEIFSLGPWAGKESSLALSSSWGSGGPMGA
jgi:hypothetical protein